MFVARGANSVHCIKRMNCRAIFRPICGHIADPAALEAYDRHSRSQVWEQCLGGNPSQEQPEVRVWSALRHMLIQTIGGNFQMRRDTGFLLKFGRENDRNATILPSVYQPKPPVLSLPARHY